MTPKNTMKIMNVSVVYDHTRENVLMCMRRKDPYQGKLNFVGGKVEAGETFLDAAYRELEEETGVTRQDISLKHLMDMTYHTYGIEIQVFVGQLKHEVQVSGDENQLVWLPADGDFTGADRFAGQWNIAHIMEMIRGDIDNILKY